MRAIFPTCSCTLKKEEARAETAEWKGKNCVASRGRQFVEANKFVLRVCANAAFRIIMPIPH
jgi:hypothetical protein